MRPIDDMLKAAQGKTRFHMPGHKGRLEAVSAALDMTELPDTDDLYAPFSGIAEAERLLARSAGAGRPSSCPAAPRRASSPWCWPMSGRAGGC